MDSQSKGSVVASSEGGVSGKHDAPQSFEFVVAPTTEAQFNTARFRLIPVTCWRVDDVRFGFNSSFIPAEPSPAPGEVPTDIRAELRHLVSIVQEHPGSPLSVFAMLIPLAMTSTTSFSAVVALLRSTACLSPILTFIVSVGAQM
jgi:hypothetical protein